MNHRKNVKEIEFDNRQSQLNDWLNKKREVFNFWFMKAREMLDITRNVMSLDLTKIQTTNKRKRDDQMDIDENKEVRIDKSIKMFKNLMMFPTNSILQQTNYYFANLPSPAFTRMTAIFSQNTLMLFDNEGYLERKIELKITKESLK